MVRAGEVKLNNRLDSATLRRINTALNTHDIVALVALLGYRKLTTASEALGVSPASLSQRLKAIEQRIGVSIFRRSTRGVEPNPAGVALAEHLHSAMDSLVALADTQTALARGDIKSKITISCPQHFGENYLEPILAEYLLANPNASTHLEYNNVHHELGSSTLDLVFRSHRLFSGDPLPPYNYVARLVMRRPLRLCASADYVRAHGRLLTDLSKLPENRCLDFKVDVSRDWRLPYSDWEFREPTSGRRHVQRVRIVHSTNSIGVLKRYALQGLGVAVLPLDAVHEELQRGVLLPLFESFELPALNVHLIQPYRTGSKAQHRLVEFIMKRMAPSGIGRTSGA